MEKCMVYLNRVFGESIMIAEYENMKSMPLYFEQKYKLYDFDIQNEERHYILVKPIQKIELYLESIRKQILQIQRYTSRTPVLVFEELRLSQRNTLVQARIPFIVPDCQIYLPGVFMNLNEKMEMKKEYGKQFSAATQVVFAFLLLNDIKETNARKLAVQLPYSTATLNRALSELVSRGLLYTEGRNTRKQYRRIEKKQYWEEGKKYLFDPVKKTFFTKRIARPGNMLMSNELALTRLSFSLNQERAWYYATTAAGLETIDKKTFIDKYDIFDDKFAVIEQFKYDPEILAKGDYIDVISLYAEFKDSTEERIQIALDEIMEGVLNDFD